MSTPKEEVTRLLTGLPEDSSAEEILMSVQDYVERRRAPGRRGVDETRGPAKEQHETPDADAGATMYGEVGPNHGPEILERDGVLVVRAEPTADIGAFVAGERERRVTRAFPRAG